MNSVGNQIDNSSSPMQIDFSSAEKSTAYDSGPDTGMVGVVASESIPSTPTSPVAEQADASLREALYPDLVTESGAVASKVRPRGRRERRGAMSLTPIGSLVEKSNALVKRRADDAFVEEFDKGMGLSGGSNKRRKMN